MGTSMNSYGSEFRNVLRKLKFWPMFTGNKDAIIKTNCLKSEASLMAVGQLWNIT